MKFNRLLLGAGCTLLLVAGCFAAVPPKVIDLWPGAPPGEKGDLGEEKDMTKPSEGLSD